MKRHMKVAIKIHLGQGRPHTLKCIERIQQMNSERQDSLSIIVSLPKVLKDQALSTMSQWSLRIGRH